MSKYQSMRAWTALLALLSVCTIKWYLPMCQTLLITHDVVSHAISALPGLLPKECHSLLIWEYLPVAVLKTTSFSVTTGLESISSQDERNQKKLLLNTSAFSASSKRIQTCWVGKTYCILAIKEMLANKLEVEVLASLRCFLHFYHLQKKHNHNIPSYLNFILIFVPYFY